MIIRGVEKEAETFICVTLVSLLARWPLRIFRANKGSATCVEGLVRFQGTANIESVSVILYIIT
jgi:hypothetical protein